MTAKQYQHKGEFVLENGQSLQNIQITYHTTGILNKKRDNVIWICHALSANSDASEWWPNMLGNGLLFGRPLDAWLSAQSEREDV